MNLYQELNTRPSQPDQKAVFMNFMQTVRGADPKQIISNYIQSGMISQPQFQMLQSQVKEYEKILGDVKANFGF